MGWRNFNDRLVLVLLGMITGLWVATGRGWIALPGEIIGATIAAFTLLIQYYFRRKPEG